MPLPSHRSWLYRGILFLAACGLAGGCSASQREDSPRRAGDPDIAPASTPAPDRSPATGPEAPPPQNADSETPPTEPDSAPPRVQPSESADSVRNAPIPTALGEISVFPPGTPDAALLAALQCALDVDSDSGAFRCYVDLNVERNRDTDIAIAHLRAYSWKVFRQRAAGYLMSQQPRSVKVTRREPEVAGRDTKTVKIFLYSKARDFPAPITLERERGEWKISYNSL